MKKITLSITIIIASLILGSFYYLSQINKQKSIEVQKNLELQLKEKADKIKQSSLSECLNKADIDYADYVRINGIKRSDGSLWVSSLVYDRADKERQVAINYCSLQYK